MSQITLRELKLNSAVKYVAREGFVNNFPITFAYDNPTQLQVFVGFKKVPTWELKMLNGLPSVVLPEDLEIGQSITIRRATPADGVPHTYQYKGNAQGGAEFSAKTIDENFEYMSNLVSEVEDYNSIAQDNLSDMESKFEETQGIANEALQVAHEAKDTADSAEEVALGIDGKAQGALDNSKSALDNSELALNTAQGIDGKAQEALDKSTTASHNASDALNIASEVDGKAQEALDSASTALTVAQGVDGKAQDALDKAQSALDKIPTDYVKDGDFEELSGKVDNKRDLDDNVFNGYLQVRSEHRGQGTGVFLQDIDGTVRGQVVATDQGLQLTQYPKDGGLQTFTFPKYGDGGELLIDNKQTPVTPQMFGATGNGKLTLNEDGDSLDYVGIQKAINFAVESGRDVLIPSGIYMVNKTIHINNPVKIYGNGLNTDVSSNKEAWKLSGAVLLAVGDGSKESFVYGITNCESSGGVVKNTSQDFELDRYLSLANYYNDESNPEPQSALIHVHKGVSGLDVQNIRIILNYNGVDGYISKSTGWGDEWDIGLYIDNARYNVFTNVQVLGYWRKNGLLIRAGALAWEIADTVYAGAEENKFYNCVFQGWKSVGIRGVDMYRCTGVTAKYIEIPFAQSLALDFENDYRITRGEFDVRNIPIDSTERVGDKLRIYTKRDQSSFVKVGDEILPAYVGNGVSGTVFRDCRMHGMNHSAKLRSSDPSLDKPLPPSACVEISGARVRGIRFEGSKLQTLDDIGLHLHQCIDVYISAGRFEGSPDTSGASGIRCITTPTLSDEYPYIVRPTYRVQMLLEQPAGDFTPSFGSIPRKFRTQGYWLPRESGNRMFEGVFVGGEHSSNFIQSVNFRGRTITPDLEEGSIKWSSVSRYSDLATIGKLHNIQFGFYGTISEIQGVGDLYIALPNLSPADISDHRVVILNCVFKGITIPQGYNAILAYYDSEQGAVKFWFDGGSVPLKPVTVHDLKVESTINIRVSGSVIL